MVRIKALKIQDREPFIDAINEFNKMKPNKKKIGLLINTYNDLNGFELFTMNSIVGCGDCRRNLKNFWTNIIDEWSKQ